MNLYTSMFIEKSLFPYSRNAGQNAKIMSYQLAPKFVGRVGLETN